MKKVVKAAEYSGVVVEATLTVKVKAEFDDVESDGSTLRYLLEQDLEDLGWDAEVSLNNESVTLV